MKNPTPKRAVRQGLIGVVLGTLTTLAVAWTIAALAPPPMYPRVKCHAFVLSGRAWNVAAAFEFGIESNWWGDLSIDYPGEPSGVVEAYLDRMRSRTDSRRPEVSSAPITWGVFAGDPPTDPNVMGHDVAFGWPRPCLWYQVTGVWDPRTSSVSNGVPRGGILIRGVASPRGSDFRALPCRVLWGRALLDVAFWSVLLFMLLAGPGAARRAYRRRRGLCLACGYDRRGVGDGAPCPECGAVAP